MGWRTCERLQAAHAAERLRFSGTVDALGDAGAFCRALGAADQTLGGLRQAADCRAERTQPSIVISQHPLLGIDAEVYKWRHLTGIHSARSDTQTVAPSACKTDQSFAALIYLAAAVINVR